MDIAHDIVEKIEQNLKSEIEHLEIVTIHYEPVKKKYRRVATFLTKDGKVAQRLRDVVVVEVNEVDEQGIVVNSFKYENPYFEHGRGHSIRLIAWLIKQNIDEVVFNPLRMDEERIELFNNLGIKIRKNS
jgi:predicted Fe-Mo cluster-binding NifX family protein